MARHRKGHDMPLSLRFIADWEQRIVKQRQLIAELKRKGRSTQHAEAELKEIEGTLYRLRNHAEIMQVLMPSQQSTC